MAVDILNAEDARRQADNINIVEREQLLDSIKKEIDDAVAKGLHRVYVYENYNEVVTEHLKELGYSVEHVDSQHDGTFYKITW